MTPVLREVDKLSLSAVQRGYAALFDRALAGKSLPDDFAGGTFTITNLGGLDVDGFTPIINPPQAAILGVGRIVEKPVARRRRSRHPADGHVEPELRPPHRGRRARGEVLAAGQAVGGAADGVAAA